MQHGHSFSSLVFCVIVLLAVLCNGYATASSTYRAAVVEFGGKIAQPSKNYTREDAVEMAIDNLNSISAMISGAISEHGQINILVLNEYALYGPAFHSRDQIVPFLEQIPQVSNSSKLINPCTNSFLASAAPILSRASCIAKQLRVVLVVNMGDLQGQPNDPNRKQYNTDVVFDEEGFILAKYHKSNMYFEPYFDPGQGDAVTFETSFGVKLGLLICFDIMHSSPQIQYLTKLGVRNFAFSSWWVNFPPVINGLQTWQGSSHHFGTNLLASSSGFAWKSSGSGIFSSGKPLGSFYNPKLRSVSQIVVADVPKVPLRLSSQARAIRTNPNTPKSTQRKARITDAQVDLDVFDVSTIDWNAPLKLSARTHTLVCEATVVARPKASSNSTFYALIATSGQVFPVLKASICMVSICGSNKDDCASVARAQKAIQASDIPFSSFQISAKSLDPEITFFPFVAIDQMAVVDNVLFAYNQSGSSAWLQSRDEFAKQVQEGLVSVSLFGRNLQDQ